MSTATCVNLLERHGADYRVTFDPAYDSRKVPKRCLDPWLMQLRGAGRGVTIYPHGGTRLAVEVDNRWKVAQQLAGLSGVELWQDGDGEKIFLFDVALFDRVAAIVKPRKRRRLTDEQKARLAAGGRQFKPRHSAEAGA
jgi:hypothetical protein